MSDLAKELEKKFGDKIHSPDWQALATYIRKREIEATLKELTWLIWCDDTETEILIDNRITQLQKELETL